MNNRLIVLIVSLMFLGPIAICSATGPTGEASVGVVDADLTASVHQEGHVARIKGCESEDGCVIDYRPTVNGGVWIVKTVNP